jgi:flavin reductase (DIM6/NTAB) family NADH-FMN oxidoreductase RutF
MGAAAAGLEENDTVALRRALSRFATGVCVVLTETPSGVWGITVNSFTSVSLDPPLVLWCLGMETDRHQHFAESRRWTVSVLEAGQQAAADRFARMGEAPAAGSEIERAASGDPIVSGALAHFVCNTYARHTLGDHVALVGEVAAFGAADADALTYFASRYGAAAFPPEQR